MQFSIHLFITAILCLLPVVITIIVLNKKRNKQRALNKAPFKELQRRPAGESLRIKIESLDEKLNDNILLLAMMPALLVYGLFAAHLTDPLTYIIFFVMSVGWSVFFGIKISRAMASRSNHILGFEGERFVGEELSGLIAAGFEVYHDVPFDGFNIDHVLVGSRGVFVIETKTRRKPVNEDGKKDFRVVFDGQCLQWPWGADGYGIEQAKNNAKTLATWLSSATGQGVWATPILTLPGWMVDRKAPSDGFYVLNPKEIRQVCTSSPEKIVEPQIRRICHQLDQKCRVEVK